MGENILNEEFDVFIAYHGTNSREGSLTEAQKIYDLLSSRNVKCFLNQVNNLSGSFSDTPTIAKHSKLFLLVANNAIPLNAKNEIISPGLYREVDAFYKAWFQKIDNGGRARVYAYGGLLAGVANNFHVMFDGTAHFSEDEDDHALQKLVDWVEAAIGVKTEGERLGAPVLMERREIPFSRRYEGIWILNGEFSKFQGDGRSRYTSAGRLILTWKGNCYNAVYCYSVSKEFKDEACVTTICEGVLSPSQSLEQGQQIVITCDIIARTSAKKMRNSSKHFMLKLTPQVQTNGEVSMMVADFKTKNTDGVLTFTKGS